MEIDPIWLTGAIGAIVGALMAFIFNFYLQTRKERKEIKAIRRLLKFNIKINLANLKKIYNSIKESQSHGEEDDQNYYRGMELIQFDVIKFKQDLWNAKTPMLAIALKEPEMYDIEKLYAILEKITSIHSKFYSLYESPGDVYQKNVNLAFLHMSAEETWEEFEENVKKVIELGESLISKLE